MSQGEFTICRKGALLVSCCCAGFAALVVVVVAAMEESELVRWKSWCDGPNIKLRRDATRCADRMLREDMARWECIKAVLGCALGFAGLAG
jgi:hypothetical protein